MQLLLGDCPFFSSGFRTTFLRQGEFGANTPLHLTRWDFGGGMMALSFSINPNFAFASLISSKALPDGSLPSLKTEDSMMV